MKKPAAKLFLWLKQAADGLANWVTHLSWWKFFLFAILLLIGGSIMQDTLFSTAPHALVIDKKIAELHRAGAAKAAAVHSAIHIDDSGIHIAETKASDASAGDKRAPAASTSSIAITDSGIHIAMPPAVAQEINDAINDAADDKAEQQVTSYQKRSSDWFMNFVLLLLLCLFGTKALMGGKKRAEAKARIATAAAEHANLQRQVSEAKMQMMQAQVEPHFLFNTLASVSHLIETDPPRAAAMQNHLIQYLRAVLPQMRETATVTNLGREADISSAYLDLLKMRMEERLTVDVAVPEGLRSAAFPPLMLQSLVENAIKHGLECKPEGGTLRVLAEVADNKLRVSVIDSGLGFGAVPSDSTGLGLRSIRDRLKLLHGDLAQLIISTASPCGVCACIEVPYQLAAAR